MCYREKTDIKYRYLFNILYQGKRQRDREKQRDRESEAERQRQKDRGRKTEISRGRDTDGLRADRSSYMYIGHK